MDGAGAAGRFDDERERSGGDGLTELVETPDRLELGDGKTGGPPGPLHRILVGEARALLEAGPIEPEVGADETGGLHRALGAADDADGVDRFQQAGELPANRSEVFHRGDREDGVEPGGLVICAVLVFGEDDHPVTRIFCGLPLEPRDSVCGKDD